LYNTLTPQTRKCSDMNKNAHICGPFHGKAGPYIWSCFSTGKT
jgi:hypothetical protein